MRFFTTTLLSIFLTGFVFAQSGHLFPDSLEEVTVTGVVTVDSSNTNLHYYLDTDGDDEADFWLKFGPPWYSPDSSDAVRPVDGETVKIYGAEYDPISTSLMAIIVYEVNDLFWRAPFLPVWEPTAPAGHKHAHQHRNYRGYAGGWLSDSLEIDTIAAEGTVMIDTTCFYWHYYLDTDADTIPDYYLSFGPYWYNPESGLERPQEGDYVSVEGIFVNERFIVFSLNGETWFELPDGDTNFGGKWVYKNMNQNRYIHTLYDSLSGMTIRKGWSDEKGEKSDSLYCQMLRLFPQDVPDPQGKHVFAGFEIGLFTKTRSNLMVMSDSSSEPVKLATKLQYRFHYEDHHFDDPGDESAIAVLVWDNSTASWTNIDDFELDTEANIVTYESETVSSFVILTSPNTATSLTESHPILPEMISLRQNYPNPFNPQTNIEFYISEKSDVKFSVYNILGKNIFEYSSSQLEAGNHTIVFEGSKLASGIYFYELQVNGKMAGVKKMSLIR